MESRPVWVPYVPLIGAILVTAYLVNAYLFQWIWQVYAQLTAQIGGNLA